MVPVSGSAYTYSYAVMGEVSGLAGRLGAGPGICRLGLGRRGRLVGLFRRPASTGWFGLSLCADARSPRAPCAPAA